MGFCVFFFCKPESLCRGLKCRGVGSLLLQAGLCPASPAAGQRRKPAACVPTGGRHRFVRPSLGSSAPRAKSCWAGALALRFAAALALTTARFQPGTATEVSWEHPLRSAANRRQRSTRASPRRRLALHPVAFSQCRQIRTLPSRGGVARGSDSAAKVGEQGSSSAASASLPPSKPAVGLGAE